MPKTTSILTKLKTVDGAGSGLDADTLDGLHANGFARAVTGIYTGNRQSSQTINLGFQPSYVLVIIQFGTGGDYRSGAALPGSPALGRTSAAVGLEVVSNGFKVYYEGSGDDLRYYNDNYIYMYLALR